MAGMASYPNSVSRIDLALKNWNFAVLSVQTKFHISFQTTSTDHEAPEAYQMMLWYLCQEQLGQDYWDEEEAFWAWITSATARPDWRLSRVQAQQPSINLFLGLWVYIQRKGLQP